MAAMSEDRGNGNSLTTINTRDYELPFPAKYALHTEALILSNIRFGRYRLVKVMDDTFQAGSFFWYELRKSIHRVVVCNLLSTCDFFVKESVCVFTMRKHQRGSTDVIYFEE